MIPTGGCALANLVAAEDPVGTATPFDQLFLIQVPPPWERIALDTPAVPNGVRRALVPALQAKKKAYVLLIDGDEPPEDGLMRVLFYRWKERPRGPLASSEYLVSRNATAELIERLSTRALSADDETDLRFAAHDTQHEDDPGPRMLEAGTRDLLVCTHGERDGCCGRFGEAAYRHLRDAASGPTMRVWRVSHFGGHRFAPTLLDLPSGRAWGKLGPESLDRLARRSGPLADLRGIYRGWCALPPEAQIVERELLMEHGWDWLEARAEVTIETSGVGHRVRLDATRRNGESLRVEAELVETEPVVLPLSCGADEKAVPQYAFAGPPTYESTRKGRPDLVGSARG